jgi:Bacterial PH domain
MTGTETDGVIEWRASPGWVLQWLALMVFVALPFLILAALMAANEIANAPEGTWASYLFFLGAFATIILGILAFGVLSAIAGYVRLLLDREPVLRADRYGLQVRMFKPRRVVRWEDIAAIEIERTRKIGRRTFIVRQILVRLRDPAAPELTIKPQMAGVTLEDAHARLNAMLAKFN